MRGATAADSGAAWGRTYGTAEFPPARKWGSGVALHGDTRGGTRYHRVFSDIGLFYG